MKRLILSFIIILGYTTSYASHITGGELMYTYLGPGASPGTDNYRITLRLFRDCYSNGPLLQGEQVRVGIYNTQTLTLEQTLLLPLSSDVSTLALNTGAFPCLVGSPRVCYQIAYYSNTIDLPRSDKGYTLVQTACCRIGGITNISNSNNAGATYTTKIPGVNQVGLQSNTSPQFQLRDTALVCSGKSFRLPFTATDSDGDSLSYSFADAYGNVTANNQPLPPTLFLSSVAYQGGYNGLYPLGSEVMINPKTGIITGRAPITGKYAVAVVVKEWRNGLMINEHRKDFILSVQQCDYVSAELPAARVACDQFTVAFENSSYSSLITNYTWDFGDPTTTSDVSSLALPEYTYPDTGVYRVKLVVRGSNGCIDSAEGDIAVYPGFKVDFGAKPHCVNSFSTFSDSSYARYGSINNWSWDFGNTATANDTSRQQNPVYRYTTTGTFPVKLVASSSKGCVDSTTKNITITDKPYMKLNFKDTTVCGFDTLQIVADGTGIFSWSPATHIINGNTSSPTVFPPSSTTYIVTLNENNCIGTDTVRINKINSISVTSNPDTVICATDSIHLRSSSLANYYTWSPAQLVKDPQVSNTTSLPIPTNTRFTVQATLGKCIASSSFNVNVTPYPKADAGQDVNICPNGKVQLNGAITGDSYTWSPNYAIMNSNTLQPTVAPTNTTAYVLTSRYASGCPKPFSDTVMVNVYPAPMAFAGNDTAIVVNQPLRLQASGGVTYQWSPATYLSSSTIPDPVVQLPEGKDSMQYMLKVTDEKGCVDYDDISITRFRTGATVFIPTGFTPNGDGKNDVLKPILAGIQKLEYFRVYNRWGQLIFETREPGRGWNGTINGKEQSPGTYVFVVQANDYTGKPVVQKGTVVLIR